MKNIVSRNNYFFSPRKYLIYFLYIIFFILFVVGFFCAFIDNRFFESVGCYYEIDIYVEYFLVIFLLMALLLIAKAFKEGDKRLAIKHCIITAIIAYLSWHIPASIEYYAWASR